MQNIKYDQNYSSDLETLDYETTFIDLSAETSSHPPNPVSTAVNCLIRAETKNEIYKKMTKDKFGKVNFNPGSENQRTAFLPEVNSNIEILSYIGSTGEASSSSSNVQTAPTLEDSILKEFYEDSFGFSNASSDFDQSNLDQSSFEPKSGNPMSRWGNVSNLAKNFFDSP